MRNSSRIIAIAAIATVSAVSASSSALAKVYSVVFAGKPTEVDCPESPEGHNLTWDNQNCTAVRVQQGTGATKSRALKLNKQ